ncbi:hypothetical protein JNW90_14435 [Micromonospora sp. STR1s_5]|nr:hypothetical protein [Micromonospora sp. STR1s_5]
MARVLFGSELGGGLGHVTRLLPIARKLVASGHECVFAIRDVIVVDPLLRAGQVRVVQAPHANWPASVRVPPTRSYTDLLAHNGFDDPARLGPVVAAWGDLIELLDADLVIADHSPALCVTLYGGEVPLILIGDGFTLPPPSAPELPDLPGLRSDRSSHEMLRVVEAVQLGRGRACPPTLSALFSGKHTFVVTLPELDFYAEHRGTEAVGPLEPSLQPVPRNPAKSWFAYLSLANSVTEPILRALVQSRSTGALYLRDATPAQLQGLRSHGLVVYDRPQPLARAIAAASTVIHHGGLGFMQAALCVGRPQLLAPAHLEQRLNCISIGKLGVGLAMAPRFKSEDVAAAIERALNDEKLQERADEVAASIARRESPDGLKHVLEVCGSLLATRHRSGQKPRRRL